MEALFLHRLQHRGVVRVRQFATVRHQPRYLVGTFAYARHDTLVRVACRHAQPGQLPSLLLVHILLRERAEREIVFALVDAYTHVGRRVAVVERDGVLAHLCLSRARDGEYPVADSVLGGHVAPCCLLPEFQVASGGKVLQQLDLPRLLHPLGGNQQFSVAHIEVGVGLAVGRLLAHAPYRVLHLAAVVAVLGEEGGVRLVDVLLRLQFGGAEDVVRPVRNEPVGIGVGSDSLRKSLLVHILVGNHHVYWVQVVGAHILLGHLLSVE